jgi:putative membrane protein
VAEDSSTAQESARYTSSGFQDWLGVFLKGIAMGVADSVPGISGGTIALITGIYERLIRAVTRIDPAVLWLVPRLYRPSVRASFFERLREMDALFLVVLGTGVVSAVVTVARGAEYALEQFPGPTFAFFFGLIAASAVVLADRRWLSSPGRALAAVAGFLLAFLVAGAAAEGLLPNSLPVVFAAGVIGICGMILPGISGSLILLLLGQYDYLIRTLNEFVDGLLLLARGTVDKGLVEGGTTIAAFLGGAVIGVFTVAYVVRWSLDRYRRATFAFLVSLMLGSLRFPALEIAKAAEGDSLGWLPPVVAAAIVGACAVLVLDHYSEDMNYAESA